MDKNRPTDEELDTAHMVLAWYADFLKRHEPQANGEIMTIEESTHLIPYDNEMIDEMLGVK